MNDTALPSKPDVPAPVCLQPSRLRALVDFTADDVGEQPQGRPLPYLRGEFAGHRYGKPHLSVHNLVAA
jgi:hypothetical protein